jgi:hypothetical protein
MMKNKKLKGIIRTSIIKKIKLALKILEINLIIVKIENWFFLRQLTEIKYLEIKANPNKKNLHKTRKIMFKRNV